MVLLVLSVCPSVCGCHAVDSALLIENRVQNKLQNSDTNRESLSDTMVVGIPWYLTILSAKSSTNCIVVNCVEVGIKWAILLRLSTTDRMASKPSLDTGSPVIKSIEITDHLLEGIARGCKRPAGFKDSDFEARHRGHVST